MDKQQTTIKQPAQEETASSKHRGRQRQRTYNFDYSYWTAGDRNDPRYASQTSIFNDIGRAVLGHALSGYHCCVFAYGQTGSGKSYTMMGSDKDPGLIPRISQELFTQIRSESQRDRTVFYRVEVSYLEIYNEKVRDLLNPMADNLRVREHPSLGPYVEDLTKAAVSTYDEMLAHMTQGNKARTVAATNMNATSSRSHAVFTIVVTRRTADLDSDSNDQATERVSRISLVDLAGSERANSTMATGIRLKEGARINQSLAALGKVISALADQEKGSKTSSQQIDSSNSSFVPYRDSVLTWLLKDSLGGNSRTFMIATISPADYSETLSTLRYADRAKHIVNVATVNEDATVKLVRQLKEEIAELRRRLESTASSEAASNGINLASHDASEGGNELEEQLAADEKLIAELNQSWEDKLRRTQMLQQEREQALQALGIAVDMNRQGMGVGLHAPRDIPHLVNLNEDPLMSECLVYNIKPGTTLVGSGDDVDENNNADIKLGGDVAPRHCFFDYDIDTGVLQVHPLNDNLVLVNGQRISQPMQLKSGYRIIIGSSFVFRLNHPQQARRERRMKQSADSDQARISVYSMAGESDEYSVDWRYAWNEAHPDYADTLDAPQTGRYSPSTWSDTQSEVSESTSTALVGSGPQQQQQLAHLYSAETALGSTNSAGSVAGIRPSSQLSMQRNMGLVPRPRRDSIASEAGGTLSLQQTTASAWIPRRRSRGQTLSTVYGSNAPASPLLGLRNGGGNAHSLHHESIRFPRRMAMKSASNTPIQALRPLSIGESRERLFYERRLARLVIRRWQRYKLVKVGEQMLRNAVHIKEANVISKELGQKVVYQFAILRGGAELFPESPLEPDALPALLSEDWDTISVNDVNSAGAAQAAESWRFKALDNPSSESTMPQAVVKVLDIAHACWYVWSINDFLSRLDKMRRLSTVKGSYRAHLVLDPFHANPAPQYSCIGTATYPIWPGERSYSAKIDAPVTDLLTGLEQGRALGSLAALPIRNRDATSAGGRLRSGMPSGVKAWRVIVHIKSLHGVSETEMTNVHCRLRLARIPGLLSSTRSDKPLISPILSPILSPSQLPNNLPQLPTPAGTVDLVNDAHSDYDDRPSSPVLVSSSTEQASRVNRPISGFGDGPVNISFRQQWTVDMLTEDTCVVIEFFADLQPPALHRAFHEDVQIEESLRAHGPLSNAATKLNNSQIRKWTPHQCVPGEAIEPLHSSNEEEALSASQNLLVERLHEEELFVDSQHEVIMWIRVYELGPTGEWEKAPCMKSLTFPAYMLRQGVQRRLEITIGHHASQNLQIKNVAGVYAGNPLLVDEKGRLVEPKSMPNMAQLAVTQMRLAEEHPRVDNRCFTSITAPWDTSVYGSRLLDAPTNRHMRVKLELQVHLEIENGDSSLVLPTDIYAQICTRQARMGKPSWLTSLSETASELVRSSMNMARIPSDFIAPPSMKTIPNVSSNSASNLPKSPSSSRLSLSAYSISNLSLYTTDSAESDQQLPPINDPVFRVFSVTLSPTNHPAGRSQDSLWRLNTGKKYVRGEEMLLPWQPRSIGFVNEYHRLERMEAWRLLVARTRERLEEIMPLIPPLSSSETQQLYEAVFQQGQLDGQSLRVHRIRQLVMEAVRRFETFKRVPEDGDQLAVLKLQQEPVHMEMFNSHSPTISGVEDSADNSTDRRISLAMIRQLIRRTPQHVRMISMQGHFCHRGWVDVLDTNSGPDSWIRRWFVVERPYLFMFAEKSCLHLDNVVNISSARISIDRHVSEMVGRPNVLALYTSTNAFLLNPPAEEVQQWISAIDEWYFML
ncbi:hypothetical protein LPJ68_003694 [Coemansia sp. RSA 1086]|nr:hypothetical protein LPJ68_003694 [Coemansia sp. RSA 1086]